MRLQRRIFTVLIFLLLGTVVNVLVAWGCTLILPTREVGWSSRTAVSKLDDKCVWMFIRCERWGYVYFLSSVLPKESALIPKYEEFVNANSITEWWNRIPSQNYQLGEFLGDLRWYEQASGWPAVSLWSRLNMNSPFHPYKGSDPLRVLLDDELERAWLVDWPFFKQQYILPLGIIWYGFAINTIFYAVVIWLIFFGPFVLRRYIRIRHGYCIKCGYNLRGDLDSGCPECGWKRREVKHEVEQ